MVVTEAMNEAIWLKILIKEFKEDAIVQSDSKSMVFFCLSNMWSIILFVK